MSCLSETSNPCEVIQHIFCNKGLYTNIIRSVKNSRHARENCGKYYLSFRSPVNGESFTLNSDRILEIFDKSGCVYWCNPVERCAGLAIVYSGFFAKVLLSYDQALKAKSECKVFCKSFKIPKCLFPNVPNDELCITLKGEQIIEMMCKAIGNCCSV